jgi:hypothetical protein
MSNTYSRLKGDVEGMVTFGVRHRSYSMHQMGAVIDISHFDLEPLRGRLVMVVNMIRNGRVVVVVVFAHSCAVNESPCDGVSMHAHTLRNSVQWSPV